MVDRVRTRRRETATLRALGVSGRTITAAVGFEAVTIALQGFAIGVASCVLLAWRLTSGPALPELRFSAPWATLVVVGILTVLAAVAASALPARRAGRDHPGQALRYHE
jgi:putative ABC transport system permease protein